MIYTIIISYRILISLDRIPEKPTKKKAYTK